MASTSASPRATNAAPMPPAPIASHANLPRPPPIAASIPTKSPGSVPKTATADAAGSRLRRIRRHYLPALNSVCRRNRGRLATPAPRKRRDAAPRSGYWKRPWPRMAASPARFGFDAARNRFNGWICLKPLTASLLPLDFDLRRAVWHRRDSYACLRAIAGSLAQMPPAPRRLRSSRARRPIRCASGSKRNWRPSTAAPAAAIPAKDEQIRRYQEAATKQQGELDRVTLQAKRMGCESSGFFSLFNGQSAQCGPVNNQIQQMRGNLDQITTSLERLRSGGHRRRRSREPAPLGADGAGAEQLRPAIRQRRARRPAISSTICSATTTTTTRRLPGADLGPQSGTYPHGLRAHLRRRLFPGLVRHLPARFPDDEKTCKALCPATEATLFSYRNPGEDINQAVSINGQPYTSLPNAFKYRTEFNPSCACKAAGPDLVGRAEIGRRQGRRRTAGRHHRHRREREEDAAARAQPKGTAAAKKGAAPATAAAPAAPAPETSAPAADATAAAGEKKPIRTVGPTFIPPKQ